MGDIKVGIIGAGAVGETMLKAFQEHSETIVAGVTDGNLERLHHVAAKYNITPYKNSKELVSDDQIDLIYVAVPPNFHYPLTLEALNHNKHVLCEKPLANSLEEAKIMMDEAVKRNLIHAVNFPTIYRPAFKKLMQYKEAGFLGKLRRIEVHCQFEEWPRPWQHNSWITSRSQGGFVREVFPHYIQMIQQLFGKLHGIQSILEYPSDQLLCETGALVTAKLEDGTSVLINGLSGIGVKEKIRFELFGTEGFLSLNDWTELLVSRRGKEPIRAELPAENHLQNFICDLVKAIKREASEIVTFNHGCEVQSVLDKILFQPGSHFSSDKE